MTVHTRSGQGGGGAHYKQVSGSPRALDILLRPVGEFVHVAANLLLVVVERHHIRARRVLHQS